MLHALEWTFVTLSALTPTCNEEKAVIRAISEVLGVDYPCDVELIMMDHRSADRMPVPLVQVLDARVSVDRHPVRR